MTANRNRKQRIRNRQNRDGVAYNTARRRVDDPVGQQSAGVRHRRACDALAVPLTELPAVLAVFAGLREPSGMLGESLVVRALEIVEEAGMPIGGLEGNYYVLSLAGLVTGGALSDDERDLDAVLRLRPSHYPRQLWRAGASLFGEIRRMDPGELRTAAEQIGVRTVSVEENIRWALFAEGGRGDVDRSATSCDVSGHW